MAGFQFQQARNAKAKLTKVRALMKEYNSSSITLTGLGRGLFRSKPLHFPMILLNTYEQAEPFP
jgi:hypothetical protein